MPAREPRRMARLKKTITPARRSPGKRISASDAVAMGQLFYASSILLLAAGGAVLVGGRRAGGGTRFRRTLRPRRGVRLRARGVVRARPLGPAAHLAPVGRRGRAIMIALRTAQRPEQRAHHLPVGALARRGRVRPALLDPRAGPRRADGGGTHVGGMGAVGALRGRDRALRGRGGALAVALGGARPPALRIALPLRLVLRAGQRRGDRVPRVGAQLGDRVAGSGLRANGARHRALVAELHLPRQPRARRVRDADVPGEVDAGVDPPPGQVASPEVTAADERPGIDGSGDRGAARRRAPAVPVVDEGRTVPVAEGAPSYVARADG